MNKNKKECIDDLNYIRKALTKGSLYQHDAIILLIDTLTEYLEGCIYDSPEKYTEPPNPEVDWSKVPVDTLVCVRDDESMIMEKLREDFGDIEAMLKGEKQ